jgi:hypothetical protein
MATNAGGKRIEKTICGSRAKRGPLGQSPTAKPLTAKSSVNDTRKR